MARVKESARMSVGVPIVTTSVVKPQTQNYHSVYNLCNMFIVGESDRLPIPLASDSAVTEVVQISGRAVYTKPHNEWIAKGIKSVFKSQDLYYDPSIWNHGRIAFHILVDKKVVKDTIMAVCITRFADHSQTQNPIIVAFVVRSERTGINRYGPRLLWHVTERFRENRAPYLLALSYDTIGSLHSGNNPASYYHFLLRHVSFFCPDFLTFLYGGC